MSAFKPQSNAGGVQQAHIEADVYRARMVQVITLGLQAQREFKGEVKKPVHEIMLTYELSDEFMKDEEGNDIEDKPRWVHETIPFYSLSADLAKSTLRIKACDPDNKFDGDISQCVDIPVNLTIVNKMKDGKTYSNVGNVAPMSAKKAATCPELKNPIKLFDIDNPDMGVYNSLPEWIKEKMRANLNFKGSALEKGIAGTPDKPTNKPVEDEVGADENPY